MAAPVFAGVPTTHQPVPADLQEEIKLYENARQREEIANRANVFSLIRTIECLEKAYIKDSVTPDQYTSSCNLLLDQFNAAFKLIRDKFPDVESFAKKYLLHCPSAMERIKEGRPITVRDNRGNVSKSIAEIVSLFITVMDRLRLDIRAMDELYPDVKELYEIMRSCPECHPFRPALKDESRLRNGWMSSSKCRLATNSQMNNRGRCCLTLRVPTMILTASFRIRNFPSTFSLSVCPFLPCA